MSDFFEDLAVGVPVDLGPYLFTKEAIVSFAARYDPQTFHLDEEAALRGPFGRLAASGWHTAAVWMKLYVAHRAAERDRLLAIGEAAAAPGPSPGFRNLRWLKPVFAGETIRFGYVVTAKRATARPGWGLVFRTGTGHDRSGALVYSFEGSVLWQRRPRPAPVSAPRSS